MNLKTVLKSARNLGLCAAVALVACDTGAKPEEPSKDAKADDAAQAVKDAEAAKAAAKAAEEKAAEEKAAADVKAAEEKAAAEAKAAEEEAPAEEAAPAEEPKADAVKAEPKKAEPRKAEPKAEDKAAKIDAKAIYTAKCKVCHAPDGKGAAAQQKNKIPDMSAKDWQAKHNKAAVVKAIAEGVDGTKMKSFKDKLSKEEIDAVAAFVKKL